MHVDNGAHAAGTGIEPWMFQETPGKLGGEPIVNIEPDQAKSWVHEFPPKIIPVVSEKRWRGSAPQQRHHIGILDSRCGQILCQPTAVNPPSPQLKDLINAEIFVQYVHAAACSPAVSRRCPRSSSNERRATATDSAIAARDTLPPQAFTIALGDIPCANSSRTCQTMIRVPLKVGLPWHISGSATIWLPSSMRCGGALDVSFLSLRMFGIYSWMSLFFKAKPVRLS